MTYTKRTPCYDADSHIMEMGDWIGRYADPDIRDRLKPVDFALAGGGIAKSVFDKAEQRRNNPDAMKSAEEAVMTAKAWWALGSSDASERSRVLDVLGLDAQLVFSTLSLTQVVGSNLGQLCGRGIDLDLLYGGCRAHNRALADFCSRDERLIAVGFVPYGDAERSAWLAEEAIDLGCGAIWVPSAPPPKMSPTHPDYHGLWARLAEARVPFMLHVGGGGRLADTAFHENGRPRPPDLNGGGENVRAKDFVAISHSAETFLGAMVLDGIFEKFPNLRGGCIEQGAGWVVPLLHRLDFVQDGFKRTEPDVAALPLRASDYIRRQVKFTPFPREPVGWMISNAGAELFLFSTDFPHPEGTKDPLGYFEKTMDGVSELDRERFYAKNFAEMMAWA
jgi:predicted TIM-barrel fold metal-dependent hydrolase